MHLLWDSKNKPGEFIVPKERAQHLRYSPDRRPLFGGPPALLPFAYPQDTRVPVDARPRWVRDMTPRLAASSKVLVRQFDEHKHQWEDWIEARVVSGAQNYRPAGLVWTYEVEVQREGKIRREWRTPCLGELWTPDCARPFSSPEEYFLRKRDFVRILSSCSSVYFIFLSESRIYSDPDGGRRPH
ncbi:hypothetical protein B0H21DRAFT_104534 [Amylocystis lapponica]|nr:hypothetical protein B0H21DRAFT_104534 [Amylocystis lapponica]